ncbi:hypothetical protein [Methylobacterium sp. J-077]|uniref:hypothetical protein n=1 Tax=Methylobacterium sp. J-077 TaxID=2836656 RepID=UPI001FBB2315|nr:hypothetical protein [Methylobacterium sp. J-077]MCJ2121365.1 hypothetical protein [Methylobacterium sp. J-077]
MYCKLLEARLAKIEANPRFGALSGLSDADLDRQIVAGLNGMASEWLSFGAMVTNLRESPMPADKEMAGQIETFIADWQAQQRQKAAQ